MLNRLISSVITIFFCVVSALVGTAQKTVVSELTDLIHSVNSSEEKHHEEDAKQIVVWNASDKTVLGVLSDLSTLGALDYVSSVYESADFYESGYWGYKGETYHSDVYSGSLPECSFEDFIRPVDGGEFTSFFGYRESYRRLHKGVDISVTEGDTVRAALPGIVGRIGYEPGGYGHFIILVHSDGVETRYAHLSRVTAVLGEKVYAGQDIAFGGSTGNSTGPHLHFEVRKHGKAMDPLSFFEK